MTIQQLIEEQMKEFDEKFVTFQPDGTSWGAGLYLNEKVMPDDIKSFISSSTRKLIEALGEEIIGESEKPLFSERYKCQDFEDKTLRKQGRNELRDIQRLKLKEIISSFK